MYALFIPDLISAVYVATGHGLSSDIRVTLYIDFSKSFGIFLDIRILFDYSSFSKMSMHIHRLPKLPIITCYGPSILDYQVSTDYLSNRNNVVQI